MASVVISTEDERNDWVNRRRIPAIKSLRERTGLSLKDAVAILERETGDKLSGY